MLVRAQSIHHSFPGTADLFNGISFELRPGELVGLTGPSGSGKSTLLSLLAGWEQPKQGTFTWEGIDSVAWVFQNPHGVPRRTAVDHVALPLLAKGHSRLEATQQATVLLERFGLGEVAERNYAHLSGGEAQRLMLARATAKRPSLLLVDEPTAQLDLAASQTVNAVLGQLADEQMIVVVATHDTDTAAACNRVLALDQFWGESHD